VRTLAPPTNEAIATVIRMLRKQAGLTQGKLAQESGLTQPAISDIERGTRLELDNLRAIAAPLGVSIWQLFRMAEGLERAPEPARQIITSASVVDALLEPEDMDALFAKAMGK
jgi:transcriptional regulator with XRE-family HTH domain